MSPDNLIQWINSPALLNRESLSQLRLLLDEYPCFTAARILYLRNLLVMNDLHFSKELIRTAISVPDRRRLYYFVEGKAMPGPVASREEELSTGGGFSIIDRFLHSTATDKVEIDFPVFASQETESKQQEADSLQKDNNLQLSDSVSLSQEGEGFTLDYASYLNQTFPVTGESVESMPGQDLIDAFLADTTRMESLKNVPENSDNKENEVVPEEDLTEKTDVAVDLPEDTFTETLAKIYLKQKRYDHALEIFRSLSLKYPEKNVYFADQIRFLEKLIINIKNN